MFRTCRFSLPLQLPLIFVSTLTLGICLCVEFNSENTHSTRRSGYDEFCNKTVKCRSQAWLTCNFTSGRCGCVKPEEMTYDTMEEKCVALLGERCKFGFDEEDEDNSSWYEKADCVTGAVCGPSGICSCPSGTYEDLNQTLCYPVKGFGESCSRKLECNNRKLLSCFNGVCSCDPDAAVYNPTALSYYDRHYGNVEVPRDTCVGRVGVPCSPTIHKYCVGNAYCNIQTGVCECSEQFTTTSDLLCGLGYQETCSSSSGKICSDQFVCVGDTGDGESSNSIETTSKCSCPNPDFQQYDETSKSCRGQVGSPCNPSLSGSCVPKASCVKEDGVFICKCDDGYVVSGETQRNYRPVGVTKSWESWKCQKAYGQSCEYGNDGRFLEREELCDEIPKLKCINGKCKCPNGVDVYDEKRRECFTGVGFSCKGGFPTKCVQNAFCTDPYGPGGIFFHSGSSRSVGRFFPGRCVCSDGFQVLRNRTCGAVDPIPGKIEDVSELKEVTTTTHEDLVDAIE